MGINIKQSNNIKNIKGIYIKISNAQKSIKWVYQKIGNKVVLLWTAIQDALSAFGAGFWQNDMPWSNDDGWKNE